MESKELLMQVRHATHKDKQCLFELYKLVARSNSGIARTDGEISMQFIDTLFDSVGKEGVMLVGIEEESGHYNGRNSCYKIWY